MRDHGQWQDISICNVSRRGMMLHAAVAPKPGTFIEVRRAALRVAARIVWVRGQFFGVETDSVVDEQLLKPQAVGVPQSSWDGVERRAKSRHGTSAAERHDHSRMEARAMEWGAIVSGIGLAITWFVTTLWPIVSRADAAISHALNGG